MFPEIRNPVDLAKRLGLVSLQEQACVPGGRKPPPTPIERKVLQRNKRFADFSVIEGFFGSANAASSCQRDEKVSCQSKILTD